jgi:heme exporter protein A
MSGGAAPASDARRDAQEQSPAWGAYDLHGPLAAPAQPDRATASKDTPVTETPAIAIHDVSKRFGPRWAVARLSFALPRGQSLLLTGHNGSGKTTLLRMIGTASFPTAGRIDVLGLDTRSHRTTLRCELGLLSHASFIYEDLTAAQNLKVLARLLGLKGADERVDELLSRVGLKARSDDPARQFSAGMRKRLAIARLLLKAPRLALLDEPFGELDPAGIVQMEGLIRELAQAGTTIVLATHLVEQGQALTQARLHLENGRAMEVV